MDRQTLVNMLKRYRYITSLQVESAFLKVERERFVLPEYTNSAYADTPLPILCDQTISAPSMVAIMLEVADLEKGMSVLEIGCGSGYNAALIAERLSKLLLKPVYINSSNGQFLVQIGGFSSVEEADDVVLLLKEKGLKNLSVVKGNDLNNITGENVYAQSGNKKVIYVKKVNCSFKIDGILDEPEWEQSIPSGDFIQQEPLDGNPSSEKTIIRVVTVINLICIKCPP